MYEKITLIGRVGQDPQMRYTPDGTPVVNFSLATTQYVGKGDGRACPSGWKESYNGKGYEVTTWWRVTAWRGLAETINQYVSKGKQLFVEARINGPAADGAINGPRVWQGNDGEHRASFEVTAQLVKFLGNGGGGAPVGEAPPETSLEEDALPF